MEVIVSFFRRLKKLKNPLHNHISIKDDKAVKLEMNFKIGETGGSGSNDQAASSDDDSNFAMKKNKSEISN